MTSTTTQNQYHSFEPISAPVCFRWIIPLMNTFGFPLRCIFSEYNITTFVSPPFCGRTCTWLSKQTTTFSFHSMRCSFYESKLNYCILLLQTYVYMFPYFWYPLKNIVMSWTTFLVMGIATERYLAVCR